MSRDLDEIEMEMGKERTMKWCTYTGNGCYKYPRQYASDCLDCPYFKECIPVEPERVKGKCTIPGHQRCTGTPGCEFCNTCYWWHPAPSPGLLQRMGMATWVEEPLFICKFAASCPKYGRGCYLEHGQPHAWRDGCAANGCNAGPCIPYQEERGWFIAHPDKHSPFTEQEAMERVRNQAKWPGYRAFRWQDGLR